jgi:ssDNA-binding Zn-finger/Zn-ribbon topoisomerase 1
VFGVNTVTALTCPECGALGLDCEPSSEDEAFYNCPECGFYRTYEIGCKEDWQEAENELEDEWVRLQEIQDLIDYLAVKGTVIRVAHAVDSLRTPREVESALDNGILSEETVEKIRSQIRKRKQVMKGLDEEIRSLEQIIEEAEKGDNR